MFTVILDLEQGVLTGLNALDFRRRFGCRDGSRVVLRDVVDVRCEVSEGFARAHFSREATASRRTVPTDLLCRGELVDTIAPGHHGADAVVLSADISPERIRELWVAAGLPRADAPKVF